MSGRNIWLIITSLVVGPAFGGLTFITLAGITDAMASPNPRPPTVAGIDDYWPMILIGAYVLGAIPGIVSAAIMIFVTRWLPRLWQRLATAPLIGGVVSTAGLSFLFWGQSGFGSLYGLMVLGTFMLSGAVAGFACLALVELFHPLPMQPKAPA
jgi:hypothetical protein